LYSYSKQTVVLNRFVIGKQRALSPEFVMHYRLFPVKGYARLPC